MAFLDKLTPEVKAKLVQIVDECCIASDRFVGQRVKAWDDAEKLIMSYQPQAKAERQGRDAKEEVGFSTLKIPYVWGLLMAQHTYLCSIFLGRGNLFQFTGLNGKGQMQVQDVETIINYQATQGGMTAALYVALYDLLMYGLCAQFYTWREDITTVTTYVKEETFVEGVPVMEEGKPVTKDVEKILTYHGYKGGALLNVKPKNLIVDPSVGLINYQDGEFLGRRYTEKLSVLKQKAADGIYFDVDKLSASTSTTVDEMYADNPALIEKEMPEVSKAIELKAPKGSVNVREVYVQLIPSEVGLGSNTRTEIWVLTVADRFHLIGCQPSGWMHGKYPVYIGVAEYDGYTLSSRGTPEIGKPLNDTMDWLINTHMYNVEKSVNNEYIYDPSMINSRDFLDPQPGKRIKIRPEAYGKDVRTFIHQFQQYDFTRQNIQDVSFVEALFQRVFGVNEQMLGALSHSGRKTATEVRSAAGFALNRLKVLSEFLGISWFNPMGRQLLSASRQMYTAEDKFSILKKDSAEITEISVDDLTGEFDLAPVDGSIPIDRMAQASVMREILASIHQMPAVAGRYDVAKMYEFTVQLLGVKNLKEFEITDPAQALKQAQLGQLMVGNQNGQTGQSDNRSTGIGATDVAGAGQ